jgi:hypothetical protein
MALSEPASMIGHSSWLPSGPCRLLLPGHQQTVLHLSSRDGKCPIPGRSFVSTLCMPHLLKLVAICIGGEFMFWDQRIYRSGFQSRTVWIPKFTFSISWGVAAACSAVHPSSIAIASPSASNPLTRYRLGDTYPSDVNVQANSGNALSNIIIDKK